MSDREQSTAGPFAEWENDSPLRETFLRHLAGEPSIADAFRIVGSAVFEWLCEFEHLLPGEAETVTRTSLRAVVADLRWTAGYLWHDVAENNDRRDEHLIKQAPIWATTLAGLADAIEAAIGPPPPAEPASEA